MAPSNPRSSAHAELVLLIFYAKLDIPDRIEKEGWRSFTTIPYLSLSKMFNCISSCSFPPFLPFQSHAVQFGILHKFEDLVHAGVRHGTSADLF